MKIVKPEDLRIDEEYWLEQRDMSDRTVSLTRVKLVSIDRNYKHDWPYYGKHSYDFIDPPYDSHEGMAFYKAEKSFNATWRTWDINDTPTSEERALHDWEDEDE